MRKLSVLICILIISSVFTGCSLSVGDFLISGSGVSVKAGDSSNILVDEDYNVGNKDVSKEDLDEIDVEDDEKGSVAKDFSLVYDEIVDYSYGKLIRFEVIPDFAENSLPSDLTLYLENESVCLVENGLIILDYVSYIEGYVESESLGITKEFKIKVVRYQIDNVLLTYGLDRLDSNRVECDIEHFGIITAEYFYKGDRVSIKGSHFSVSVDNSDVVVVSNLSGANYVYFLAKSEGRATITIRNDHDEIVYQIHIMVKNAI